MPRMVDNAPHAFVMHHAHLTRDLVEIQLVVEEPKGLRAVGCGLDRGTGPIAAQTGRSASAPFASDARR